MPLYEVMAEGYSRPIWLRWCDTNSTCTSNDIEWIVETESSVHYDCTSTANTIWYDWTTDNRIQRVKISRLTEEEKIQRQERRAKEAAEDERRIVAQILEEERLEKIAENLLLDHMDEEQKKEYEEVGHFHVISQDGNRYRVEKKRSGNVVQEKEVDGKVVDVLRCCLHSRASVPLGDDLLSAMILLKGDEQEYLRLANKSEIRQVV